MRRTVSLLFLAVGITAIFVPDTANARHRRCCPSPCPVYRTTFNLCPQYKMMQMGGLNHYYCLEYVPECQNMTPVSYDTAENIPSGCTCPSSACCFSMNRYSYQPVAVRMNNNGDHVHGNLGNPGIASGVPADEPFESNAAYSTDNLNKHHDFLVVINDGGAGFWARCARFTTKKGPTKMDLDVGYQVSTGATPDVTADKTTWTPDPNGASLGTLTITGAANKYNGTYQVVQAH